jgi:hypothetical protein
MSIRKLKKAQTVRHREWMRHEAYWQARIDEMLKATPEQELAEKARRAEMFKELFESMLAVKA